MLAARWAFATHRTAGAAGSAIRPARGCRADRVGRAERGAGWRVLAVVAAVPALLVLLLVRVVGFGLDTSFPTSPAVVTASQGHIFGIFETKGWHNLAATGFGDLLPPT